MEKCIVESTTKPSLQQLFSRRLVMIKKSMVVFVLFVAIIHNLTGAINPVVGKAPKITPSYFVDDTGSGTTCSQAAPCLLSTALAKPETDFNVYLAAGNYTGTGNEVILLTKNISLYGGWAGTTTYPPVRDPETYISVIDGQNARRGITILGGSVDPLSPSISGLWITNGNASGLTTNCTGSSGTPSGCGGGIFIYNASPYIQNNYIYANAASKGGASMHAGYGGGLYARFCSGTRITANQINNNLADDTRQGSGGGVIFRECPADSEFDHNTVFDNSASIYPNTGFGAGLALSSSSTYTHDNDLIGNGVTDLTLVYGSGIYMWYGSPMIVNNLVSEHKGRHAVYFGYGDGSIFSSNRLINNQTAEGIHLVNSSRAEVNCTQSDIIQLDNNFISQPAGTGLHLYGDAGSGLCSYVLYNSFDGGSTGILYEGDITADLSNNITSNHSGIGIDTTLSTTTPTVDHTLFYNNGSNGYLGTNAVNGDPQYIRSSEGNLHIWCTSAARDAGILLWVVDDDIDGQTRPVYSGVDIGADECTPLFYLPLIKRN
jgi:hypothetical protein